MKIWFDTEFWDTGERIHLISVGLVREDGAAYYAEVDPLPAIPHDHWLVANVLPHLKPVAFAIPRDRMAADIQQFVGDRPEFWAYVADYDWVALSQLFGPLINRPKGWPWTALDTYQLPDFKRFVVKSKNEHNALSDALALWESWEHWRRVYPNYQWRGNRPRVIHHEPD